MLSFVLKHSFNSISVIRFKVVVCSINGFEYAEHLGTDFLHPLQFEIGIDDLSPLFQLRFVIFERYIYVS